MGVLLHRIRDLSIVLHAHARACLHIYIMFKRFGNTVHFGHRFDLGGGQTYNSAESMCVVTIRCAHYSLALLLWPPSS